MVNKLLTGELGLEIVLRSVHVYFKFKLASR